MLKLLTRFLFSAAVLLVATQALGITRNPDTVDELDVSKYLGLWYQMYGDAVVMKGIEKDSYCDTALYGDNGDGTISVHNYASMYSANGTEVYTIDGMAYVTDPTEPGKLTVKFDPDSDASAFPAPYWVLELGPEDENGLYSWAIVSDNLSAFLFVLARDIQEFNEKYDAEVTATLTELGFTGLSAPIAVYQGSDCVYE